MTHFTRNTIASWLGAGLGLVMLLPLGAANAAGAAGAPGAGRHKLEVSDAGARAAVQAGGGRLLAEYESFQIWEAPPELAASLAGRHGVVPRDGDNVIELHAQRLDTMEPGNARPRGRLPAFAGQRLHLVQFVGPVKPEWHAGLRDLGVRVLTYVPRNAYLVYGDATSLQALRDQAAAAPHIQWEGEYLAGHKVHPAAQLAAARAARQEAVDDLFAVQLVRDDLANAVTLQLLDQMKRQMVRKSRFQDYLNFVLRLPPERLAEVAGRPDVVSIQVYQRPRKQDERQDMILIGALSGGVPTGPGYLAWLASKGFTAAQFAASGFAVDVSDSGIDNGTTTPGHPGLYVLGNTASSSRVVYNRLLGTPNPGSTIQGCDGHGNLNSHIISGYNALTGFPHTDAQGYHYGLGVAPFVRVGSSVIFDPDTFTDPDYEELQSRAYQDGARISCNSWGANVGGAYTIDCQIYDALVRDAQPVGSPFPVAGNQEMVIVFSAGNAGSSANSIGSPGTAKNIISVGAAENVHSHSSASGGNDPAGNDGCAIDDTGANSADDIIFFSSRGPCDDGRVKPDVVGPGTHVTGGVGQQANPGATGTALTCFMGTGVCALPGGGSVGNPNNFFPLNQEFYTTSSGTSHSCPAVGGGAALLRQYFINRNWPTPSPAMTKAWLMGTARYLTGVSANDTLPSNNQGFGSMNLGVAFDGLPRMRRDQLTEDRFSASGQTRVFNGFVTDTNFPVRVTLAWTDAPGSTTGNAYNNNLDLTVTTRGQTYRGNVFNGAFSVPGGSPDPRNNVESVFLPAGLGGPITITVTAANINSDGVPGNGSPLDQDFALVAYNASDRPVFPIPAGAAVVAEDCAPANGAVDPGETVTVALTLRNVGPSNSVALVATLLPTDGVTAPSAPQNYGVLAGNGGTATRQFSFTASGRCGATVVATLQLQDGTNDLGTATFDFPLGMLNTNTSVAANPTPVVVDEFDGLVMPYPSAITVSGAAGEISKVTVTLHGLGHSWPADLDVVLVGPQGQAVTLLSDAGGGLNVTNLTLTFDDAATNPLPRGGLLTSGTWRPTDYEADASLPEPAPAGPYASALAAFRGTDPNGTWQLYVADDYPSDDGGALTGGWSLTVFTTNRVCCLNPAFVDLEVSQTDTPDPVALSNLVTYTITVTNQGPAVATTITLTDALPAPALFVSVSTSQGSCSYAAGLLWCDLGALAPGAGAVVQMRALAGGGPQLTSAATVTSAQPDLDLANNQATATTTVLVPGLSITDSTVIEGDAGLRSAVFLVALSQPSSQTVEVDYRTVPGTATPGLDYVAQTNRLRFQPGEIAQTIVVAVWGDTLDEDDETFTLELFNPRNASLARAAGVGTILDDDPMPSVSISDAVVVEGNSGTTNAVFLVALSAPSGRPVTVSWATSNGTARAGSDYVGSPPQMLTVQPGQALTNLSVTVNGDAEVERDETFLVLLANPTNAVLGEATGVATILTDDFAPIVTVAGYRLLAESDSPPNGRVDPGETVTISLALRNEGSTDTTNLVVTLLPGGGVANPSGPQTYGALPGGGPAVSRPFTFTAAAPSCATVQAVLQLRDGSADLGTTVFTVFVGNCIFDDFEPDIDLQQWSAFGGSVGSTVLATNYGGAVSDSNSLWFGAAGSRFATTRPLDTSGGGTISFFLRLADGSSSTWELADLPDEGVVFEYSADDGTTWAELGRYTNSLYTSWTQVQLGIPAAAQGPATLFRWRQLANSGTGFDHWALDDITIVSRTGPPEALVVPSLKTVFVGDSATFAAVVTGTSPFAYQWRFNGTNLAGRTGSELTLVNLQTNQAGLYSVVVTNVLGAVTSAPATLRVLTALTIGEAVDAPYLTWTTGGTSPLWTGQLAVNHDGEDAAQSGAITHSQTNWIQTTVTGPGAVSFWWRVSSEGGFDYLEFYTNGILAGTSISGEVPWQQRTNVLGPGSYTLRWSYRKDGSVNSGQDRGWVDQVTLLGSDGPPFIVSHPTNVTVGAGSAAGFSVLATGRAPLAYQWRQHGTNLPGRTNASLTLTNVSASQAGPYTAVVTNTLGATTSAVATLTVLTPPVFLQDPQTQSVLEGETVTFSVVVEGTPPLSYRWRRNSATFVNFPGAPVLTITNVPLAYHSNYFDVIVTNVARPGGVLSGRAYLYVLVDNDHDRMADEWELAHGLDPTNAADALLDTDGDTMINRDEYLAGTDPTDAHSYLKVDNLTFTNSAVLTFLAVSNRTYGVQYKDAVTDASWVTLAEIVAGPATAPRTVTDTNAAVRRIYRLILPLRP